MLKEFQEWPLLHRALFLGISAVLLVLLLAGGLWEYVYAWERQPGSGSVIVDIPAEATGSEIASLLEEKEVIASAAAFRTVIAVTGDGPRLQHGHYRLHQGETLQSLIAALKKGTVDFRTVTIPEGSTVAQIGDILYEAGIGSAGDFTQEAAAYGPLKYMYGPEAAPVKGEGFLFADTYDIPVEYSARQICDMMYRRTDEILTPAIRQQAEEKQMTLHDLMTLASMVEREARFKEDQIPIASVMLKRLEVGMPLQIDATIQYALGSTKADLTTADTQVASPYNTYLRTGLPPGPIGAPGLDAIEAVLAARPGEYLYYVAKADGHHVFTKTYEEHNAQIGAIYGNP